MILLFVVICGIIITAYIPNTETFEIDLRTRKKGETGNDCLSCKSGMVVESTTVYTAVLKNCVLIIKNVPCVKCGQCGDVLYNTETLEKIDGIAAMAGKMASEVSIIDYAKVA